MNSYKQALKQLASRWPFIIERFGVDTYLAQVELERETTPYGLVDKARIYLESLHIKLSLQAIYGTAQPGDSLIEVYLTQLMRQVRDNQLDARAKLQAV